ncbi:MAG: hypothetical protein K8T10_17460 [Candidatus Eremiobacteraeota bacterium]|nr:hypothetical protein [Candidatus Eremiobacteraeota bacterium]
MVVPLTVEGQEVISKPPPGAKIPEGIPSPVPPQSGGKIPEGIPSPVPPQPGDETETFPADDSFTPIPPGSSHVPSRSGVGSGPGPGVETSTTRSVNSGLSVSIIASLLQLVYIIILLAMGGLLGFYYYKSFLLNLRIHRLELLIEKSGISPTSKEEPLPFSWDQALKSIEGGWTMFTDTNRIYEPGVVGIISADEKLAFKCAVNLIYRIISLQNLAVIYLSKEHGEEDLGKALLSLESGVSIDKMSPGEREELVGRYSLEMTKYEAGLFVFQDFKIDIDELYENILKLSESIDIGMIIVDGRDVISADNFNDLIGRLRIISIKSYIPVVYIDAFKDMKPENIDEDTLARITALIEVEPGKAKKTISFTVHKFKGDPPPESLDINPDSGEITTPES